MTDEQIIKALECCHKFGDFGCGCCPLSDEMCCRDDLKTSALSLINRQKAENKRLLQKLQQAQSEAIKEFAERLIRTAEYDDEYSTVFVYNIKQLVKEMMEVQE